MADRAQKTIIFAVLVLGGVAVFLSIWMNRFTYAKVGGDAIRTNRLTGKVEWLFQGQWTAPKAVASYSSLLEQVQRYGQETQQLRKTQLTQQRLIEEKNQALKAAEASLIEWEVAEKMAVPADADDLVKLTAEVVADKPKQVYTATIHNNSDFYVTELEVKFIPADLVVNKGDELYLPHKVESARRVTAEATAFRVGFFLRPGASRCFTVPAKSIARELWTLQYSSVPDESYQPMVACKFVAAQGLWATTPVMWEASRGHRWGECDAVVAQVGRK